MRHQLISAKFGYNEAAFINLILDMQAERNGGFVYKSTDKLRWALESRVKKVPSHGKTIAIFKELRSNGILQVDNTRSGNADGYRINEEILNKKLIGV